MTVKYFILFCSAWFIFSCNSNVSKIEGQRLEINQTITPNQTIDDFIAPYRNNVNKNLDSVISFAPKTYSKSDGEYNTAIGNLMADAVFTQSNPIFRNRTGKSIDFVLLNHGGIRAVISKGNITTRMAYEVMPFENTVVIVALNGKQVYKLVNYLTKAKRAHPVSKQFLLEMDENFNVITAKVNGKTIEEDKTYYVATSDYLYNGGDRMTFFHPNDTTYVLDYKIRNVLIDYFKKTDTLNASKDYRFIQLKD